MQGESGACEALVVCGCFCRAFCQEHVLEASILFCLKPSKLVGTNRNIKRQPHSIVSVSMCGIVEGV